ncbi:MAG: Hsp33 family molecular chaperone HslO [Sphingobium sp.]|mgnify:CR=1 FL=1|nr:Hsp33 family molecular chaperone HslO [Sphingobium sp.]MBP6111730.1 Hsp33 family molecular chaperone HslO [Sphingobium sp.]MBP8671277.1 Hsp33 family molecular chaperone HslO [Sphingobium sp.]MBP9158372.1 Hsp33 family molecular chaperone HslO [Sphingobium sp.]
MSEAAGTDRALGFIIPSRHARGRVVRLGGVLDEILSAHAYPPVIERLLAEALVLAALLGSTLKNDAGQLTLQAQTESGAVSLLVADYMALPGGGGALRGYAQFDPEKLVVQGTDPTLFGLFGKGYLAITVDQAASEGMEAQRYQGIVPLEGASLGKAAEHYFFQSEQIPSFVQIDVRHAPGAGCVAGGLLVQHLAEGEVGRERLHVRHDHPEWEHVQALVQTIKAEELTDDALALDDIVWRLFHEEPEVRVLDVDTLSRGCRCDEAHIRSVIGKFPAGERKEMADSAGNINVDCAFCSKIFPISLASLNN